MLDARLGGGIRGRSMANAIRRGSIAGATAPNEVWSQKSAPDGVLLQEATR